MSTHGGIIDSGQYFEIVPTTRQIIVPPEYRTIGTVGDHLSEQLTFKCPKLVDGHDITQCMRKYVTWQNVDNGVGHDELKNMIEDGEYLYFTWDISSGLTVAKGVVSFAVHFEDVDSNDRTIYRWSTTGCEECVILNSINAAINRYESIYVSDDTLVFDNYTAVKGNTLALDANGIIPNGTMQITSNGTYDVARYSAARVAVNPQAPAVTISENGVVKAQATGLETVVQLGSEHDPDFIAENIKKGANIFGVEGAYDPCPLVFGEIVDGYHNNNIDVGAAIYYSGYTYLGEAFGVHLYNYHMVIDGGTFSTKFVKNTPIIIMPSLGGGIVTPGVQSSGYDVELSGNVELIQKAVDGSLFVLRPTGDNFKITLIKR